MNLCIMHYNISNAELYANNCSVMCISTVSLYTFWCLYRIDFEWSCSPPEVSVVSRCSLWNLLYGDRQKGTATVIETSIKGHGGQRL